MATNHFELNAGSDEGHAGRARPGSTDMIMGLQLVRASAMASTRLQLALARHDRPQAMSALDLLIDVDAEIEHLVRELSVPDAANDDLAGIGEWLAAQKAAIAGEKFSLACAIDGSGLVSPPDRLAARADADTGVGRDRLREESPPSPDDAAARTGKPAGRRWHVVLLLIFAVLAAAAASLASSLDLLPVVTRLLP